MVSLAGCASSAPPGTQSTQVTAESVLAAYHPRTVRLVQINVTATVTDPFPADEYVQGYHSTAYDLNATLPLSPSSKVLTSHVLEGLWAVQDNDTVILGTYRLHSNKHDILYHQIAISANHGPAILGLGGIDYRVVIETEGMASAYFGGLTIASTFLPLPFWGNSTSAMRARIDHDSVFPMARNFNTTVYEQRHVNTTVILRYWGTATFQHDPGDVARLRADPRPLERDLPDFLDQFAPGGRIGQLSPWCGGAILKATAPCMSPWEHPLV
jgi:hypothetical protein